MSRHRHNRAMLYFPSTAKAPGKPLFSGDVEASSREDPPPFSVGGSESTPRAAPLPAAGPQYVTTLAHDPDSFVMCWHKIAVVVFFVLIVAVIGVALLARHDYNTCETEAMKKYTEHADLNAKYCNVPPSPGAALIERHTSEDCINAARTLRTGVHAMTMECFTRHFSQHMAACAEQDTQCQVDRVKTFEMLRGNAFWVIVLLIVIAVAVVVWLLGREGMRSVRFVRQQTAAVRRSGILGTTVSTKVE